MRKLMLEALATWMVLAAVSGQAGAALRTGAKNDLLSMVVSRGDGVSNADYAGNPATVPGGAAMPYPDEKVPANGGNRANAAVAFLTSPAIERSETRAWLTTGVRVPPKHYLTAVDRVQVSLAPGFSSAGAGDFNFGGKKGHGTEPNMRANFNQHDAGAGVMKVLDRTYGGGGPIKTAQSVQNEGSAAAKFGVAAATKRPLGPEGPVPEPGSWATVLAGLLGVIAIARRRMSL
jgi:hypothetical protein